MYRWAQQKKGHSNSSGEPFSSCLENRLIRFSLIWLATVAAYRLRIVRTLNLKVPKHKLLCMIHRKFDEAFNHVRSSLPEPTEANFRCIGSAFRFSGARLICSKSKTILCTKPSIFSAPYYPSGEKYLSIWVQAWFSKVLFTLFMAMTMFEPGIRLVVTFASWEYFRPGNWLPVNGFSTSTMEDDARYDNRYIRPWELGDLVVIYLVRCWFENARSSKRRSM